MPDRERSSGGHRGRVPLGDRGPGESYRPDDTPPSVVGLHQPGIATPFLDHLAFAALDFVVESTAGLREQVARLSHEAERIMAGRRVAGRARARPGRAPEGLTVTLGLGPALFGSEADDRFGLARRRPLALRELPGFPGDALEPWSCGGDLCVQVCAHRLELARDALADLLRASADATRLRWAQEASARRAPGDPPDGRPRNLLGFKDGTNNLRRGRDLDRHVWVTGRERAWMLGGTFLVVRRVRVRLEAWDALSPTEQERVIGRHRDSGAPLGHTHEFDRVRPDDDATPPDSHSRMAAPASNGGAAMLRRGYSYNNGTDDAGRRDAGLMLLLYQRDPRRQFVPVQRRLAEHDALTPLSQPLGSAVFAIPPGTSPNGYLADRLFA